MDKRELEAMESRCTQEDMPLCQAACPLRVDVRTFMARMAAGDAAGGRKILERSMPLVNVLARICDHPCEEPCLRGRKGGALAIGRLERACVENSQEAGRSLFLPRKTGRAALLGGGLSALTTAFDLGKKGYGVTLYVREKGLGGRLLDIPESVLPRDVLDRELDKMTRLGVHVEIAEAFDATLLDAVRTEYDAVYVELSETGLAGMFLSEEVDGVTLLTKYPGVFCGSRPEGNGFSPVREAACGRKAGISMDRHMSGVSLTVARDKEGIGATRLFTSVENVRSAPRVVCHDPAVGYALEEAVAEAGRCLQCQCLECVKRCVFLERFQTYPKSCARHIYNNLSIVQGNHTENKMINSCTLCGLCTEICPQEFSMSELCLTTRQKMVDSGNMPPSAHEFALEDMEFSNGPEFALMRAAPGEAACAHLFFPGCQLGGEPDGKVPEAYAFLRERLQGGVGLALGCCGVPALWAGRRERFEGILEAFRSQWAALGKPRIITSCASCQSVFAEYAPDMPAVSLWRVIAKETCLPGETICDPENRLAVHDPCTSRYDRESQMAVRAILGACGAAYDELPWSGPYTECCGFGGLVGNANPDLAWDMTARRAAESPLDYVTTCAMCRDRLARSGKRTYHLLDLLFPGSGGDPAERPDPGFSGRREERARLKRSLLATVWGEESGEAQAPAFNLDIAPAVRTRMEERRILAREAGDVIAFAEENGNKFHDLEKDSFLACLRPRRVTYWIEYRMEQGTAVVCNAYSHRMEIIGIDGEARLENVSMSYLPENGEWRCVRCGDALEPASVRVSYLNGGFSITLLACRKCGTALLPEYLALGKMHEVEQLMEDK